jgi:RNase P subunit RPR2
MGIEWIVVWLLALASFRVVKVAAVDAWAQIHGRPAPSLEERRQRTELAQRQCQLTGTPGVGQAIADRLAMRIANPPPRSPWITEALSYIALLLADAFAYLRRRHIEKQRDRAARERGEQPRRWKRGGPYCEACEYNPVAKAGDKCDECAPRVLQRCPSCGHHVPVAELQHHRRCATCRQPEPGQPAPSGDVAPDAPVRLVLPAWAAEPS